MSAWLSPRLTHRVRCDLPKGMGRAVTVLVILAIVEALAVVEEIFFVFFELDNKLSLVKSVLKFFALALRGANTHVRALDAVLFNSDLRVMWVADVERWRDLSATDV